MAALQSFGGQWTQTKLAKVGSYLTAYTTALKNMPFRLIYIDAFAGTGYRTMAKSSEFGLNLFEDQVGDDIRNFHDGSAKIALQIDPRFDKYYFIEQDSTKCAELEKLKEEFPDKQKDIRIFNDDANTALLDICENWNRRGDRAVLFLDPFGMNVTWNTVEAIAKTESIDMWYLFPLGVGVMRMLTKDGNIPDSCQRKLDGIFGESDWREKFYKTEVVEGLLFSDEVTNKSADAKQIADYFVKRLKTIFAGVAEKPLPLYNAKNNPIYLLCFASGNPRGAKIALKIAGHILKGR
jgi:three-Cys-motif partner protein